MRSLLILLPLIITVLLNLPFNERLRKPVLGLALTMPLLQVLIVLINPLVFWSVQPDPLGPFFAFRLAVDNLSLVLLLSIGLVVFTAFLMSGQAFAGRRQRDYFLSLSLIALCAMNAVVMSTGIFSMYVFIEAASVASFILIAMQKDKLALEGTFKYIMLSSVASAFMLASVGLLLFISPDTSFSAVYGSLGSTQGSLLAKLAVGFFLIGVFIKSGVVPFHGWLPDAYSSAPSPVSVLLAGIITKTTGVYVLMRMAISVFGLSIKLQAVLLFIGALSIVIGAIAAIGQVNIKRLLAYSSISQVGYIILGLGCATPLAIAGSVLHLFNHAIFKGLLFTNAAAISQQAGVTEIKDASGLGARMPVTNASFMAAILSASGVPPFAGFWSKLFIVLALFSAGRPFYGILALAASAFTMVYLLRLNRRVFWLCAENEAGQYCETKGGLLAAQVMLALIIVVAGLLTPFVFNIFIMPVGDILR